MTQGSFKAMVALSREWIRVSRAMSAAGPKGRVAAAQTRALAAELRLLANKLRKGKLS